MSNNPDYGLDIEVWRDVSPAEIARTFVRASLLCSSSVARRDVIEAAGRNSARLRTELQFSHPHAIDGCATTLPRFRRPDHQELLLEYYSRTTMALLQTVVTVHGIATEGLWQEVIAPVLYPHFEPRSKKYRSYRYLGPLDLLFEPWALFPGLLIWGTGVFVLPIWHEWRIVSLLAVLLVAHLLAPWRLGRTVRAFIDDADPQLLSDRVHLIAHSLGSYIACTALRDEEPWFLDRLVLTGCVVTPKFDWTNLVGKAPKRAFAVRNEVARLDFVSVAASLLSWRLRDFGSAGQNGFNTGAAVQTVPRPGDPCSSLSSVRVHNYVSAKKGHSGVLRVTYVKNYWLPFFWGIDPHEFREFLDACFELFKAIDDAGAPTAPPASGDLDRQLSEFMRRSWSWAGSKSISGFLANSGRALSPATEKVVAFGVCMLVAEAQRALQAKIEKWRDDPIARRSYRSAEFDERIRALDPRVAVARAHAEAILPRT